MNKNKLFPFMFGLLFIVVGSLALFTFNPKEYDGKTEAIITDFGYEYDTGIDDNVNVYLIVKYEVKGKTYNDVRVDYYHVGLDVGDTIEIYYKTTNPSEVTGPGKDLMPIVSIAAIALGTISVFFGVIGLKK